MKFVKVIAIVLLAIPLSASARGYLVPVVPSASITVGGEQSYTVTTGQNIPNIRWSSTNGSSFKTTLNVNNSSLCGGLTNNQTWSQGRTSSGVFDLGVAPKAREGCVLTFNYEVKSRTGHQRTGRATLRYVAPVVAPAPVVSTPVLIEFKNVGYGDKVSPGSSIAINWESKGLTSDNEIHVYLDRADGGPIKGSAERLNYDVKNFELNIPYDVITGEYVVVIAVTKGGADTLFNAKLFKSKSFVIYSDQVIEDDGELIIITDFVDNGSVSNNDEGSSRDYNLGFKVKSNIDLYISPISATENSSTTDAGLMYKIDGPYGAAFVSTAENYVGGKELYENINGIQYFKVPKNTEIDFVTNVTLSKVSQSGQYRVQLQGFNYLTSPTSTIPSWHNFVKSPEDPFYRSAYRTINENTLFGGLFNKINSFGNSLGSVVSGAVNFFQFFR